MRDSCTLENSLKNHEQIVTIVYLHFILFKIHKRVTATEMKLDILIRMAVEHVLAQKSKESAKWTTQVGNTNQYVSVNAAELGNYSGRMPWLRFFSVMKQISAEFFSPKYSRT